MLKMILEAGEPEFNPAGKVRFAWGGLCSVEFLTHAESLAAVDGMIDGAAKKLKQMLRKERRCILRQRKRR
jgi:hypothetical protein